MTTQKTVLIYMLWLLPVWLLGQENDSTFLLPEVEVTAPRLTHFTPGSRIQTLDSLTLSLYQTQDLSAVISEQSLAFNRTYGLGGLATPSFRGAGAAHTSLIWNGFQLQSPMNGQMDIALVPANFFSEASLHYGGSGALFGSGSVGGSIHFDNKGRFGRGLDIGLGSELGSFGHNRQQARVAYSTKKYSGSISGLYQSADNNFTFINPVKAGSPTERQVNAALTSYGFLQENYIQLNPHHMLKVWLWHQNTQRELPPTMVAPGTRETQQDSFLRIGAEWSRHKEKFTSYLRAAFFDEWLEYAYPQASIHSLYQTHSFINEGEVRAKVRKNHLLNIGANYTRNRALTDAYGESGAAQDRVAFFGSYKIISKNERMEGQASIREEIVDFTSTPLMPSAGASYKLRDWLRLKGNLSRTYRLPTFNDLYWQQGGNPDLQPEKGWSGDAGLAAEKKDSTLSYSGSFNIFSNRISNWIIWLPGPQYWSPRNVQEVWSRGIEADVSIQKKFTNNWRLKINAGYSYVISENISGGTGIEIVDFTSAMQATKKALGGGLGKQLIYVPHHKALGNFNIGKGCYNLWVHQSYTGRRYTSASNDAELPGFWLTTLRVSAMLRHNDQTSTASVRVENLFNTSYRVINWRPMPGRTWYISLNLTFNKPHKSNQK